MVTDAAHLGEADGDHQLRQLPGGGVTEQRVRVAVTRVGRESAALGSYCHGELDDSFEVWLDTGFVHRLGHDALLDAVETEERRPERRPGKGKGGQGCMEYQGGLL